MFTRVSATVLTIGVVLASMLAANVAPAQIFSRPTPPAPIEGDEEPAPPRGPDAGAQSVRIDRLEKEIRALTGQIEQLQFQMRKLEEARAATVAAPAGVAGPLAPAPSSEPALRGRRSDAFDPTREPNAPGVPRPLGTSAASAPLAGGLGASAAGVTAAGAGAAGVTAAGASAAGATAGIASAAAPSAPPSGASTPPGPPMAPTPTAPLELGRPAAGPVALGPPTPVSPNAPPVAPSVAPNAAPSATLNPAATGAPPAPGVAPAAAPSAREEYDAAAALFKQGQYDAAEKALSAFLVKHPKSRLVPEATFTLGETYFQRSRPREAAENYLKITTAHSSAARAPEALLRLGQSLQALGAQEQACASFAEVARKYPSAAPPIRASAEREAKKAQC